MKKELSMSEMTNEYLNNLLQFQTSAMCSDLISTYPAPWDCTQLSNPTWYYPTTIGTTGLMSNWTWTTSPATTIILAKDRKAVIEFEDMPRKRKIRCPGKLKNKA